MTFLIYQILSSVYSQPEHPHYQSAGARESSRAQEVCPDPKAPHSPGK